MVLVVMAMVAAATAAGPQAVASDVEYVHQQELADPVGAAGDRFGHRVAVDGDTAVVGSPDDDGDGTRAGAAHVFVRNGGSWSHAQELRSPAGTAQAEFGSSVAVRGDTIFVAACCDAASGTAHVFNRAGDRWEHSQELVNPAPDDYPQFGVSMAIDEASAVVGASTFGRGAAHVYSATSGIWSHVQMLEDPDPARANTGFAFDVGISGDTVVVGAGGTWVGEGYGSGVVHVFVRSAGIWSHLQELTDPSGQTGDWFGMGVAISGATIVAGSYLDDGAALDAGAAHVFARDGDGLWMHRQELGNPNGRARDWFGRQVAIDGDTIVVGEHTFESPSERGAAHVFSRTDATWSRSQELIDPSGQPEDRFGFSVAVSEETIVVGANHDDGAGANAGAAHVFAARSALCDGRTPTITGTADDDVLRGTPRADVIIGFGGDDIIRGNGGDDVICGWTGNDVIAGGPGADRLFGDSGDDRVLGQDGDDVLSGGPGRDRLDGRAGDDTIDGGPDVDVVSYSRAPSGVTVSLLDGSSTGADGIDSLLRIENIRGSRFDDRLIGDGGPNHLLGGEGDDQLQGGGGDDRLEGGDGNDTIDGGDGTDRAGYAAAPGAVFVDLKSGTVAGGAGNDSLGAIETVVGSRYDDILTGDDNSNWIFGRDGDDQLHGGLGRDILIGMEGTDWADGGEGFDRCVAETEVNCDP